MNHFRSAHRTGLPVVALSLPLTSPFSLGCKINRQHLNVCHFQADDMSHSKFSLVMLKEYCYEQAYRFSTKH